MCKKLYSNLKPHNPAEKIIYYFVFVLKNDMLLVALDGERGGDNLLS